jgi:heavy metal efflux system protein
MIGCIYALPASGVAPSAAIGFIALCGQAVLDGVVMLSHCGRLRERRENLCNAVCKGTLDRLRAVIMPALLAMQATVVIGGLASATLLTPPVMPALCVWAHHRAALRSWSAGPAIGGQN